uniref:C-type natriuretic peptide 2 n=1 Tax=Solea senegalensis TaxID=28829 RepID=UPI001CD8DD7F|nr:C-type natriuretic peptide 2 [Solea senegalensis]
MAPSLSLSVLPLLLLYLIAAVESRPPPQRDDKQVLHTLFGSRLSSLILATATSDDVTEGSAGPATPTGVLALSRGVGRRLGDRREAVPRFFLDFLQHQAKTKRRTRKSMVGGRGCFGRKMDRIGSISGLGC